MLFTYCARKRDTYAPSVEELIIAVLQARPARSVLLPYHWKNSVLVLDAMILLPVALPVWRFQFKDSMPPMTDLYTFILRFTLDLLTLPDMGTDG